MRILMVLTSHDQLGNTGRKTGFWLEEFAAPYFVFRDADVEVTLVSPKGGQPPIANTKRLVNTSLPPDVELGAGWDACMASLGRPAAQDGIKALFTRGFHKPGDVENRLGYHVGQIAR